MSSDDAAILEAAFEAIENWGLALEFYGIGNYDMGCLARSALGFSSEYDMHRLAQGEENSRNMARSPDIPEN